MILTKSNNTDISSSELSYRKPMAVLQKRFFPGEGNFPVCPRCKITMEREYQNFCDRCGQKLDWKKY